MKTLKNLLCLLLACLWANSISALIPTDRKQRLTTGWEFIRQDMGSIWEVMRPVPGTGKPEAVPLWQKVTLPHCFNAEDAVDPYTNYYQGAGWYRTTLHINSPYQDGRIYLEFEGAGQNTEVYVYTTLVASHTGGYDEWKADITEAVEQFRSNPACRERFVATTAATRKQFPPTCPTSTSTEVSTAMSTWFIPPHIPSGKCR